MAPRVNATLFVALHFSAAWRSGADRGINPLHKRAQPLNARHA